MRSKQNFDPTPYDPLYCNVMSRCLAIQAAIGKYNLPLSDTPFEEWKALKSRFWNMYVYPKFEPVYFEIFPDEKAKKDDPERFKHDFNILDYNKKIAIALCAWLKRDGFFHLFEGEVFFINPSTTDLAFVLTDGVPFRRFQPQHIGTLLELVATDAGRLRKKYERLAAWLGSLGLLAGLLVWVLVISMLRK